MKFKILLFLFLLNLTSCSSDNSIKNTNKENNVLKNNSSIISSGVVDKNVSDRNTINDKQVNNKPVQADTLVLNPLRPYLESTPVPNYNNSNIGSSSNSYSNTSPLAISDEKMTEIKKIELGNKIAVRFNGNKRTALTILMTMRRFSNQDLLNLGYTQEEINEAIS